MTCTGLSLIKDRNPYHLLQLIMSSLNVMVEMLIGVTLHLHTEQNAMGDNFNVNGCLKT